MNTVEQIEVLVLPSTEDLEIYIETDDELRRVYEQMTQEEVESELDEPLKAIEADYNRRCVREPSLYWLRVSKDSDGSLAWDFQFLTAREPKPVSGEEEPCSPIK